MVSKGVTEATEAKAAVVQTSQESHGLRRAVGVWGSYTLTFSHIFKVNW